MSSGERVPGTGFLYGLYQARLRRQLHNKTLPRHVAMIIDGNRRWAKERALETTAHGHKAGAAKMREFLRWCDQMKIQMVTIYLLSADNLALRHQEELEKLFEIIADLAVELSQANEWRIQHVGQSANLPEFLVNTLKKVEEETEKHGGLHVNLAVGYGSRREIVDAMRNIVREHGKAGGTIEELANILTPELIGKHLYTQGQPDPDLIIRTSGEQRLSDFMLWQAAHSEFWFVEALGPDLREVDFLRALRAYATRHRRYGQ